MLRVDNNNRIGLTATLWAILGLDARKKEHQKLERKVLAPTKLRQLLIDILSHELKLLFVGGRDPFYLWRLKNLPQHQRLATPSFLLNLSFRPYGYLGRFLCPGYALCEIG